MSDIGDLRRLCQGIPDATTKRVMTEVVELLVGRGGIQLGAPDHQTRAKNLTAYYLDGRTSTTADAEFSVLHGLGKTPYVALAVLPLDTVGARTVRLRTTRAADSQRIYLSSPDTDAPFTVLIEG